MINNKKIIVAFLPLLLLCVFYGYKAIDFPIHDFSNYYFGGTFISEGNFNAKIYFPYEFNTAISDLGYKNIFASYAPNTPFLAFLFLPFCFIAATTAKLVFNCISIGLFFFSVYRLFSFYRINPKFALLVPILFLVPIKNNLLFGQVYFLLFFLLSEGWLAYEKERWKQMAFFWSLAILLKVFPILLLVFLIFKRKTTPVFLLIGFCFLLLGISLFFTGMDIWSFYLKEVLPKASNGEIATAFVPNYQSVFMFLKELFVFHATDNPKPFFHASGLFPVVVFAFKIGVLSLGYFVSKTRSNAFVPFSYWVLAMILLSPYGSTYSFILLLFPFVALLKSEMSNVKKILCCLILFLICNLPLSIFIEGTFPFSYLRLFLLIAFFTVFVIWEFQKSAWIKAILIGSALIVLGTFCKQSQPQKSEPFLAVGSPILIYDYEIRNNQLTYFYWNEKGENRDSIPFKASSISELEIKENQVISKHRKLTSDESHKLKPMLIDDKTVLYLSDYDRGIGFYTLRKIELH